jgi:hypothetical protein
LTILCKAFSKQPMLKVINYLKLHDGTILGGL